MPWLAVKRLTLFESENHALIFNENVTAAHVVLADVIRKQIDAQRDLLPEMYRRSWRLTRLVAVYLVGQILRVDPALNIILDDPKKALRDRVDLEARLALPVKVAAATLQQRRDSAVRDNKADEFNVDFKRQSELYALRDRARDNFLLT